MASETIAPAALHYQKDGAIGWIIADNPARMNALTAAMWLIQTGRLAFP